MNCSIYGILCSLLKERLISIKSTSILNHETCFNVYSTLKSVLKMASLAVQPNITVKSTSSELHSIVDQGWFNSIHHWLKVDFWLELMWGLQFNPKSTWINFYSTLIQHQSTVNQGWFNSIHNDQRVNQSWINVECCWINIECMLFWS